MTPNSWALRDMLHRCEHQAGDQQHAEFWQPQRPGQAEVKRQQDRYRTSHSDD